MAMEWRLQNEQLIEIYFADEGNRNRAERFVENGSFEKMAEYLKRVKFSCVVAFEIIAGVYQYVSLFTSGLVEEAVSTALLNEKNISGSLKNVSVVVPIDGLPLSTLWSVTVVNLIYFIPILTVLAFLAAVEQVLPESLESVSTRLTSSILSIMSIMYFCAGIPSVVISYAFEDPVLGHKLAIHLRSRF